jgi:hypothetical protein
MKDIAAMVESNLKLCVEALHYASTPQAWQTKIVAKQRPHSSGFGC